MRNYKIYVDTHTADRLTELVRKANRAHQQGHGHASLGLLTEEKLIQLLADAAGRLTVAPDTKEAQHLRAVLEQHGYAV